MNLVRLVIRDASRAISGTPELGLADCAVSALAAEPETIDELDLALARFRRPTQLSFFEGFIEETNDAPHDAGVVVIDIPARLVAYEVADFELLRDGGVPYHDGASDTEHVVPYHLPDDWHVATSLDGWRSIAAQRRGERAALLRFDARPILYGRPLLEFLAAECHKVPLAPLPAQLPDERDGDRDYNHDHPDRDVVRDIHARWMTTPREDLHGAAPRDVMLARNDFIGRDVQDRSQHWSQIGECPRPWGPKPTRIVWAAMAGMRSSSITI